MPAPQAPSSRPFPEGIGTRRLCALLLAAAACALPVRSPASPATLRAEVQRFSASAEAAGLSFCALFAPLERPCPGSDRAAAARPEVVWFGADRPLVPASLAKIPTTAFALQALGPDFRFQTRFFADGSWKEDTLDGDLVVAGGGDPFLVSERLWLLARDLRAAGLRRVAGRLVLDESWFGPDSLDPVRGVEREVSERPYAAQLSPLAVNFNAAAVRITPAAVAGKPAEAAADPLPTGYLRIVNGVRTVGSKGTESWSMSLQPEGAGEVARLSGTVRAAQPSFVEYRSVRWPGRFAASLLRAFLVDAGIAVDGATVTGRRPPGAAPFFSFPSLPLRDLVSSTNRYSNNFMADLLAMALGAWGEEAPAGAPRTAAPAPSAPSTAGPGEPTPAASTSAASTPADSASATVTPAGPAATRLYDAGRAASLTEGGRIITRRLRAEFGAGPEVVQVDGSGLNPRSRLTGAALLRVLQWAARDPGIGPDFGASLAVPGQDGTLRRRFAGGPSPILRAKTGTMSNPPVSGMAGWFDAPDGPVAFVLLMNGSGSWDSARMRSLQEGWIREYRRE